MSNKIQLRRGLLANLPTLDLGEMGFTTDTESVYIGGSGGNVLLNPNTLTVSGIIQNIETLEFVSDGASISHDTAQTPDTLVIGLADTVSNSLLVIEKNNIGQDYGHAQQANPTIFIHSNTDAGVATDEWLALYHNTTDGIIETGSGAIKFISPSNKVDLNDNALINSGAGPIKIGFDGTPVHVSSNDEVYIEKNLELAGNVFFTGTTSGLDLGGSFEDDEYINLGDSDDAGLVFTTSQDQDALWIGVDVNSRHLHIGDKNDSTANFGFTIASNPTVYIHSADSSNINQWLNLFHDQADGRIETGLGDLVLAPNDEVKIDDVSTLFAAPTLTESADEDYALKITQTLNDSSAQDASETYSMILGDATITDSTGWGSLTNLINLKRNGNSVLRMLSADTGSGQYLYLGDQGAYIRASLSSGGLWIHDGSVLNSQFLNGQLALASSSDGAVYFGSNFGSGITNYTGLRFNTTTDQFLAALGSEHGRQWVFTDYANITKDHDHDITTHPTVYFHSATDPDSDNTEYGAIYHDSADLNINVGTAGGRVKSNVSLEIPDYQSIFWGSGTTERLINYGSGGGNGFWFYTGGVIPLIATSLGFFINNSLSMFWGNPGAGVGNAPGIRGDSNLDQFLFFTGSDTNNNFVFASTAYVNSNFDHADASRPIAYFQSGTDPDTDNTQWMSVSHDATDAEIAVGTGGLNLQTNQDNAANGQTLQVATATTELTAMSGATATASNLIPAGAVVLGITARVTTTITGATTFDIGDGSDVDAFGAGIALAAGTTSDNSNWTIANAPVYASATNIVLTANGSSFTDGDVRLTVHYFTAVAPTS